MRCLTSARAPAGEFRARYNIAPTQPVLTILNDGDRSIEELRWGLVPGWAESPAKMKLSTFNARVESLATSPSCRSARSKRCALVAHGYFEWKKNADGSKTPMWIHRRDGEPFVFAGVWDMWRSRTSDEVLASCTIVTQPPNAFVERMHSRMPVVLNERAADAWLEPATRDFEHLLGLLEPTPARDWDAYAVDRRVGNVRNDDASLIVPLPVGADQDLTLW